MKQHDAWNEQYKEKLKVSIEIPSIFIDPVLPVFDAQASDEIKEEEWRAFARETNKLWTVAKEKEKDPFVCNSKCNSPSDFFNGIPTIQGIDKGLYSIAIYLILYFFLQSDVYNLVMNYVLLVKCGLVLEEVLPA